MANKAVLGVAALATTAYLAKEQLKDYQCRREEEQEQQRVQERMAEIEQKLYEEEERQQRQRVRNQQPQGSSETMKNIEFSIQMREGVRDMLVLLLQRLRVKAVTVSRQNRTSSGPDSDLPGINLPVLGTNNSPDEIVFAAALALGDAVLLQELFNRQIITSSPDLVLAKLDTAKSLALVQKVLRHEYRNVQVFERSMTPIAYFNNDTIIKFIYMSVFIKDPTKPQLVQLNIPSREAYSEVEVWTKELGLFFFPQDAFKAEPNFKAGYVSHKLQHFREQIKHSWRGDDFYLANFPASSFRVPIQKVQGDRYSYALNNITLLAGKNKLCGPTKPTMPQLNAHLKFMTAITFSRHVEESWKRLSALIQAGSSATANLSVEHIAATSGDGSRALKSIRNEYIETIENNYEKLATSLTHRLEQCIPSPCCVVRAPNATTQQGREESAAHARLVQQEIARFVPNYIRLLDLSYCVVPTWNGEPPSAYVPQTTVYDESLKGIYESIPRMWKNEQRSLELDERSRLIRSRNMVAPSRVVVATVALLLWAFLYWLSYAGMCTFFRGKFISWMLVHFLSLPMSASALEGLLGFLEAPLLVSNQDFESKVSGYAKKKWATVSNLTESCLRFINHKLGRGARFDEELLWLKHVCLLQYRRWLRRCAQKSFFEALRRKKITARVLHGLLTCFAAEKDDHVECTFPGTVEEAKAFISLQVVPDAPTSKARKGDKNAPFCIEKLFSLSADVTDSLEKFPVGARVAVDWIGMSKGIFEDHESSEETVLGHFRNMTATIVSSYLDTVVVLFDGEKHSFPIPAERCCLLKDESDMAGEFPLGARVTVNWDKLEKEWPSESAEDTSLVACRAKTGSVVSSYPGLVVVHVDGEVKPVVLPSHVCTVRDDEDGTGEECAGQVISMGTRVLVQLDGDNEDANHQEKGADIINVHVDNPCPAEPEEPQSTTMGSVVGCNADYAFVQVDGEEGKVICVPVKNCVTVDDDVQANIAVDDIGDNSAREHADQHANNTDEVPFERAQTVEEALRAGGWELKRSTNHLVYVRPKSQTKAEFDFNTFVMASTPSDQRASRNALAMLNRLNRDYHSSDAAGTLQDGRVCKICDVHKAKAAFSSNQWHTGKNKCMECIQREG